MWRRTTMLMGLALAVPALLGGCGTTANLTGFPYCIDLDATDKASLPPPKLYGGVAVDVDCVTSGFASLGQDCTLGLFGIVVGVCDMPLSAIGDTATALYVIEQAQHYKQPPTWVEKQPAQPCGSFSAPPSVFTQQLPADPAN